MKTTILSAVLLATAAFSRPQPGLPFLLIWPTARSTELVAIDVAGGIRELGQGHVPWEG